MTRTITFSADEELIREAEAHARARQTTLDEEFRKWLADYVGRKQQAERAMQVIAEMQKYVRTGGRKFTREELNER